MTTPRDTHELRLAYWPRLSTFPTTAAVIAAAIGLDFLTFVAWFAITLTLLHRAADAEAIVDASKAAAELLPNGWLLFLAGLHGVGTAHFGIKRKTWDPDKAATASNGGLGANGPAAAGVEL